MEIMLFEQPMNALEIFQSPSTIQKILQRIENEAIKDFMPDVSTVKGRKEIASRAYKVSQSKTLIDSAGKNLVADWKQQAKLVDENRKLVRDRLDTLRDKIRKPLTEWEAAEKAREAAEQLQRERDEAEDLAWREHTIWKEEQRLRHEAEERQKAEERLRREQEIEAAREEERRKAEERIQQAEQAKIEAQVRVKFEAELAVQRERQAQEDQRRALEEERQRREADAVHRQDVIGFAVEDLVACGLSGEDAKRVISMIVEGKVRNVLVIF